MTIDTRLFHVLWTNAVGTTGYDKEQWMQLESQIVKANRQLEKPSCSTFGPQSDEQILFDAKHGTSFGMK